MKTEILKCVLRERTYKNNLNTGRFDEVYIILTNLNEYRKRNYSRRYRYIPKYRNISDTGQVK